jgi:cytochrome c-type protein NapB
MKKSYAFGLAFALLAGCETQHDTNETQPLQNSTEEKLEKVDNILQMPIVQGSGEIFQTPTWKKVQPDREPIQRNYVHQPPLIPHAIDNYRINLQSNKCLTCHSWANYKEANATKISTTHFKDRDGNFLANIAPRHYFCTQCHVAQVDADPLVDNTFEPVQILKIQ